jgi:hypothetical protein
MSNIACYVMQLYIKWTFTLSGLRKCSRMAVILQGFAFILELLRRMKQGTSFSLYNCSAIRVYFLTAPSNVQ